MAEDLLARGAVESRKRAAVLYALAAEHDDDSLLTAAATAYAEAGLLDEIAQHGHTVESCGRDAACIDDITRMAEKLGRLLVKED